MTTTTKKKIKKDCVATVFTYRIYSNKRTRRLLNFHRLLEGGAN